MDSSYTRFRSAFSLIELLVAIAITSLMMLLIGRIVGETQQAVSRGVELGEVISNSRSVSSQMQADADAMFGPHGIAPQVREVPISGSDLSYNRSTAATLPGLREGADRSPAVETGGVMVIVKHAFLNQPFDPTDPIYVGTPPTLVTQRLIYSDQLSFIRERLDDDALTPATASTYLAANDLRAAPFERVWYGHLAKTDPNGTPIFPTAATPNLRNGEEEPLLWLLGRHATLLFEEPEYKGLGARNPPVLPTHNAGQADPEHIPLIHAIGIAPASPVEGFAANQPVGPFATGETRPQLASGLTDSAFYALSEPSDAYEFQNVASAGTAATSPRVHRNGAIVGGWQPNYVRRGGATTLLARNANGRLWSSLNEEDYHQRAVEQLTFSTPVPGSSFGNRLRANPYPSVGDFEPWRVAQSHPILAEGVTDFVVEFAADADGDGEVDVVSDQESIRAFGNTDAEGEIKWYTDEYTDNNAENTGTVNATNPVFDPARPLTFALPGSDGVRGGNPKENAFRETIYNVRGTSPATILAGVSSPLEASVAFVFRHDAFDPDKDLADPANAGHDFYCNWPYLLRVRYRMHDGAGKLAGPDSLQGIWFEQVLRVDRPLPN